MSTSSSARKLTDAKVLIFDVYGTLADWETGIYNALQPLLSKYPASQSWTRKEALAAFASAEIDLQSQYPGMLYSDLLAKVHEVLEERLKAQYPTNPGEGGATGATLAGDPAADQEAHKAFGLSIENWPIFPDTCEALQRLSKHFKLVVLSNVDRTSFRHTHSLLAEGPTRSTITSDLSVYTYPEPNPHKYWHPRATPNSKSPFTLILTAQDTGCYKPALGGFLAVLDYIRSQAELFGNLGLNDATEEQVKDKVMSVAQSLVHDHEAASQIGLRSVWIDRQSAVTCNVTPGGPGARDKWSWRSETLGELADAVEKEIAGVGN
ncbi:hypothetical protein NLJ89_g3775 [Agrocybe chaxingu]|uniref:Haloacid dehalogenase n=1 Tax=Agrocybe chaxingu TaxID=84603 RepID=A0A9W8K3Z0_9AGAR|nr:hypothetical protein NLJ89_g3775 [Agrocybe chaxingu]